MDNTEVSLKYVVESTNLLYFAANSILEADQKKVLEWDGAIQLLALAVKRYENALGSTLKKDEKGMHLNLNQLHS